MRLPNGYGSISKLSGNRRRPWRVRITVGWDDSEDISNPKQKYKNIGYYKTRSEAMNALAQYHTNPASFTQGTSLEQIYFKWSAKKFTTVKSQAVASYKAAFNMAESLHDKPISDITLGDLQQILDLSPNGYNSKSNFRSFFSQILDYSIANKLLPVGSNFASHLDVGKHNVSDCHTSFTAAEIDAMWANSANPAIRITLMMIYSGCRPGELLSLEKSAVNLDEQYYRIISGKTSNAARSVPIADKTLPFFREQMSLYPTSKYFIPYNGEPLKLKTFSKRFQSALDDIGILNYTTPDGQQKQHLPDDTRHTFASMWTQMELNEVYRRFIQGHSRKGIGEQVYTHLSNETLLRAVNRL